MASRKKMISDNSIITGVIYARYSSHNQREESIEQQIEECTAFAQANGITVTKIYADKAISGRTDKRTEFQRMMRDAEKKLFQVVIAYKSNRIARNMLNALQYEAKLDLFGIQTLYAKEEFGNTAAGRFALRTMMNVNQFYSENMGEDIRRGLHDNAVNLKASGKLPLGYKKGPDGKYAIDEEKAPIVREIFSKVADGISIAEIMVSLNDRGITTQFNRPFNKNSFHRMLENERYIGVYNYCGVRVEDGVPPIISKEVFYTVQQKLKGGDEDSVRRKPKADYLLTGKLFCGYCGSPMLGVSGTSKTGATHFYYQCKDRRAGGTCRKEHIERSKLERLVVEMTRECIASADVTKWLIDGYIALKKQAKAESDLPIMEAKLSERKKALANIMKAIEAGIFNDTTAARMKDLEAEISTIERSISIGKTLFDEEVDGERMQFYIEKLRTGDIGSQKYCKELIQTMVKTIRLWDDRIEIEYNFTGTDGNGFKSYRSVKEFLSGNDFDDSGVRTESPNLHFRRAVRTLDGMEIILTVTMFGFVARACLPK